ncbi:Alpha/Beta hydrolase fold [Rhypophila decipiens]
MASALTQGLSHGTVVNESCCLHYWYIAGTDPDRRLITFIPGGNGHGIQFFSLMKALSAQGFNCVTLDRRQMSASQPVDNIPQKPLSPPQQARDARAVIKTMGHDKSIVFGSSSGGIFALQFAQDFPDMVEHLIVHEAPLVNLLPDSSRWLDWFVYLVDLFDTQGIEAAQRAFVAELIGYDAEGVPPCVRPDPGNSVNFWSKEFKVQLGYMPNLWKIKQDKVSVGAMRAVRCEDAFFARAADELAKVLECEFMVVPGHHQGFEVEMEAFLPSLLEMLDTLEKRKEASA